MKYQNRSNLLLEELRRIIISGKQVKEEKWTESIAAGSKEFAERIKIELGKKA